MENLSSSNWNKLKNALRPGGMHEMLEVSEAVHLYDTRVPIEHIQEYTIPTKKTYFVSKKNGRKHNHNIDKSAAAYAHHEISKAIKRGKSSAEVIEEVMKWQYGEDSGDYQLADETIVLLPARFKKRKP